MDRPLIINYKAGGLPYSFPNVKCSSCGCQCIYEWSSVKFGGLLTFCTPCKIEFKRMYKEILKYRECKE